MRYIIIFTRKMKAEIHKIKLDSESIRKYISHPKGFTYIRRSKIFNTIQRYKNCLIIDFRNHNDFSQSHMRFSLNFSPEIIGLDKFINYNSEEICEQFLSGPEKLRFNKRKRLHIFLIPSENSVCELIENPGKITEFLHSGDSKFYKHSDSKGLLCSYLMYKGLQEERISEIYIYPYGFKSLLNAYPFLCLFQNSKIYIEPYLFQ